eukprot:ANDGO_00186.mRNA.1 hypothetical protein
MSDDWDVEFEDAKFESSESQMNGGEEAVHNAADDDDWDAFASAEQGLRNDDSVPEKALLQEPKSLVANSDTDSIQNQSIDVLRVAEVVSSVEQLPMTQEPSLPVANVSEIAGNARDPVGVANDVFDEQPFVSPDSKEIQEFVHASIENAFEFDSDAFDVPHSQQDSVSMPVRLEQHQVEEDENENEEVPFSEDKNLSAGDSIVVSEHVMAAPQTSFESQTWEFTETAQDVLPFQESTRTDADGENAGTVQETSSTAVEHGSKTVADASFGALSFSADSSWNQSFDVSSVPTNGQESIWKEPISSIDSEAMTSQSGGHVVARKLETDSALMVSEAVEPVMEDTWNAEFDEAVFESAEDDTSVSRDHEHAVGPSDARIKVEVGRVSKDLMEETPIVLESDVPVNIDEKTTCAPQLDNHRADDDGEDDNDEWGNDFEDSGFVAATESAGDDAFDDFQESVAGATTLDEEFDSPLPAQPDFSGSPSTTKSASVSEQQHGAGDEDSKPKSRLRGASLLRPPPPASSAFKLAPPPASSHSSLAPATTLPQVSQLSSDTISDVDVESLWNRVKTVVKETFAAADLPFDAVNPPSEFSQDELKKKALLLVAEADAFFERLKMEGKQAIDSLPSEESFASYKIPRPKPKPFSYRDFMHKIGRPVPLSTKSHPFTPATKQVSGAATATPTIPAPSTFVSKPSVVQSASTLVPAPAPPPAQTAVQLTASVSSASPQPAPAKSPRTAANSQPPARTAPSDNGSSKPSPGGKKAQKAPDAPSPAVLAVHNPPAPTGPVDIDLDFFGVPAAKTVPSAASLTTSGPASGVSAKGTSAIDLLFADPSPVAVASAPPLGFGSPPQSLLKRNTMDFTSSSSPPKTDSHSQSPFSTVSQRPASLSPESSLLNANKGTAQSPSLLISPIAPSPSAVHSPGNLSQSMVSPSSGVLIPESMPAPALPAPAKTLLEIIGNPITNADEINRIVAQLPELLQIMLCDIPDVGPV